LHWEIERDYVQNHMVLLAIIFLEMVVWTTPKEEIKNKLLFWLSLTHVESSLNKMTRPLTRDVDEYPLSTYPAALAELSENKTGPWPALSRSKIFFIPILLRAKPKCPIDQPSTYWHERQFMCSWFSPPYLFLLGCSSAAHPWRLQHLPWLQELVSGGPGVEVAVRLPEFGETQSGKPATRCPQPQIPRQARRPQLL
jgi:hypothetical protein